jgi:hypothetical protein
LKFKNINLKKKSLNKNNKQTFALSALKPVSKIMAKNKKKKIWWKILIRKLNNKNANFAAALSNSIKS